MKKLNNKILYFKNLLQKINDNFSYILFVFQKSRYINIVQKTIFEEEYFRGTKSNYYPFQASPDIVYQRIYQYRFLNLSTFYGKELSNKKILDIGCSNGLFLHYCDVLKMKTYGIDISKFSIKESKSTTKAQTICGDVIKILDKFPSSSFDIIVCFDTIEHIKNHELLLTLIFNKLKTNGLLYIITPNGKQKTDKDLSHVNLKKLQEWVKIIQNHKFFVIKNYTYRWYDPIPSLFMQLIHLKINKLLNLYIEQAVIIAKKS